MTRSITFLSQLCLWLVVPTALFAQTITNQPQSVTVNNASTAEFTVGASNVTSYQWQFNGTNLSDGTNISGSTNSTLTLEVVSTNDMGNYSVLLNGSLSSSNAALTVVPGTVVSFAFSGFTNGGTNVVDVQLFDHDKPATVQNFLHYINSGAFLNMFYHRVVPGFVLQGGALGASNQTSTNSPITGWSIPFVPGVSTNPPFPTVVDSEFGVGPLIHNRFGTLAMALRSSSNSAAASFFFNLADNSANLDVNTGGFTVFGRVLDNTNVLQYFNTLAGNAIITNAVIETNGALVTNTFPMPVDQTGLTAPGNANLVYSAFTFPNGAPPPDTNPPTVTITSPTSNAVVTNANPVIQGTATDDISLANVQCVLTPQAAADGTLPNSGTAVTNLATGTSNWSATMGSTYTAFSFQTFSYQTYTNPVPVGVYQLTVQSQDGAGNLSPTATQPLTNSAVVIVGDGTVTFTSGAASSNNPVGYPFQTGTNYQLFAAAATNQPNQLFVNWSSGTYYSTNPSINFQYEGAAYTATFISNTAGGIDFTAPTNNPTLSNTLFSIAGTINTGVLTPPVTVTCQIFTNSVSNVALTMPQSTSGTNSWTIGVTNFLPTGSYFIQALATDAASNQTLIVTNFSFVADTNPPSIAITNPVNGAAVVHAISIPVQGTAASDGIVPVASVNMTVTPQAAHDGVVAQGAFTNHVAIGTTNWSLDLSNAFGYSGGYIPPGTFQLTAQAVDEEGNTASQTGTLTINGITTNGTGTVSLTHSTNVEANPYGYPLQYDTVYKVKATAAKGWAFVDWTYNSRSENLIVAVATWPNFTYVGGLLTANFIPLNTPRGTKGIAFTYPPANARVTTNSFPIKGTIAHAVGSAQVTVQVYSLTTGLQVGALLTNSGTTTWSVPVTNLPPDYYGIVATATNANGLSTVINEDFEVQEFKGVAGTYNGLFICSTGPVEPTNSGFCSLTVSPSGSYSARLQFPAYRPIAFSSAFSPGGNSGTFDVAIKSNAIAFSLTLGITNNIDELTGTVYAQNGSWSSPLVAYRDVTKLTADTTPAIGKYVLDLLPQYWTATNGYASLIVGGGGALTVSGALPDGAAFSQSTRVSTNGVLPVYAIPSDYRTNGMIMGWATNTTNGQLNGLLNWVKGSNIGAYFRSGVRTNVVVGGIYYRAQVGNYSIVFQGGSIATPMTNQLTVAKAGAQFKPVNATDKLDISISATGVITGHFVPEGQTKAVQFKGIYLGQTGGGFILDSGTQTGYFDLEPSP